MTEPSRTSTGIAYLTFDASLNTDASMIIQQKLDLSGNTTAQTFCENAFNLALGRDISGSLLTDSEITDYDSNNLVYLGSNNVNVQKTFLSSNINSTKSLNQMCNAYDITLGKNNQIPLVSNLQSEPEPEPEPEPIPEPEPEPEVLLESDTSFSSLSSLIEINSTTSTWRDVATSSNGQYIYLVNATRYLYKSNDYGATYTTKTLSNEASVVACSESGQIVVAVQSQKSVKTSSNFGENWTNAGNGSRWWDIGMSKDGTHILIGNKNHVQLYSGIGVYISKNSGSSYEFKGMGTNVDEFESASVSYDGQYSFLHRNDGDRVYISSNYFSSFTSKVISNFTGVAYSKTTISDSGQYMAVVASTEGKGIFISSDYGNNWSRKYNPSNVGFSGIKMSSSGKYIVASGINDYIYISYDYGENWEKLTSLGSKDWRRIDVNFVDDEIQYYFTVNNGKVYKGVLS